MKKNFPADVSMLFEVMRNPVSPSSSSKGDGILIGLEDSGLVEKKCNPDGSMRRDPRNSQVSVSHWHELTPAGREKIRPFVRAYVSGMVSAAIDKVIEDNDFVVDLLADTEDREFCWNRCIERRG